MFIDYLTLVLLDLVAGLILVAWFLFKGIDEKDHRAYAAPFFGVGLIALVTGFHISLTWPMPGAYNIAFGDTTVLLGVTLLITAISLWKEWDLFPASIIAFFGGIDSVINGVRIFNLGYTQTPLLSGIGFVLAGLAGVLSAPYLLWLRKSKVARWIGIVVLVAAAVIWAITFTGAAWNHLVGFAKWVPATMAK